MGKSFGMFDKLDDIVYEPIKLVYDAVRMPMKNHDIKKQQEFDKDLKKFEEKLELDRERRKIEMSVDERRMNEEINQMMIDRDMQRRADIIDLSLKYKKEMAEAAAQLGGIIAQIGVESRRQVLDMYKQSQRDYLEIQDEYRKQLNEQVKSLKEMFPDGSFNDIIRDELSNWSKIIAERSVEFTRMMNDDVKSINQLVNTTIQQVSELGQKYLISDENTKSLAANNTPYEISSNEVKAIEQKD